MDDGAQGAPYPVADAQPLDLEHRLGRLGRASGCSSGWLRAWCGDRHACLREVLRCEMWLVDSTTATIMTQGHKVGQPRAWR